MGELHLNDWQLAEHFLKICPHHVQHFLKICPHHARSAWIDFESSPHDPVDRFTLPFSAFQDHMQSVWAAAANKQRLSNKYKPSAKSAPLPQRSQPSKPVAQQPSALLTPSQSTPSALQDIPLTCKGCHTQFTFTAKQQEFHSKMGFDNQPAWCKACKPISSDIRDANLKKLPCWPRHLRSF